MMLVDKTKLPIAQLANTAYRKWQYRLAAIREIRILALIRRYRSDVSDKEFYEHCRVESWELPIIELKVDNEISTVEE